MEIVWLDTTLSSIIFRVSDLAIFKNLPSKMKNDTNASKFKFL